MLDKSASIVRRCEYRYLIDDCESTEVTITYSDGEGEHEHRGSLADLSMHGVRISLACRLDQGLKVQVRLVVPSIELDTTSQATIRWLQPRDGESWWVGCELRDPIPHEIIQHLATAKLLNRRRDPRYEVSQVAKATWELADESVDVQVVNYSKGGFCMLCSEGQHFPNERVMLLLDTETAAAQIPGRVMWQRELEQGRALGCAFTTMDGFVQLRDIVEPGRATRQDSQRFTVARPIVITRWIAITVLVLLSIKGLQVIDREKDPDGHSNALQSAVRAIQEHIVSPILPDQASAVPAEDRAAEPRQ